MGAVYNSIPDDLTEVDVIIAGGGTAGCVVASRLSDAEPVLSILVVERGQDNWNDPTVSNPFFCFQNILPLPEPNPRMMYYQGQNGPGTNLIIPAGSILGGGSSINMMTYARARRQDLDAWDIPGWSADNLLPYMKKLETYHGPGLPDTHGNNGPLHISGSSFGTTKFQSQFIAAAEKIGLPESTDLQDLESKQSVQRSLHYINQSGVRQDAAHAYLHPRLRDGKHPNLHVLVEHDVTRITFEGKRAVGVEVRSNPAFQDGTQAHEIKARKMVIVSAGTLGSPLLLERSGVGSKEVLARAGVNLVVDLPGVGNQLQDHNTMLTSYYSSLGPDETYDDVLNGNTTFQGLLEQDSKMLAWNGVEITSRIRPTDEEINSLLAGNARGLWDRDFGKIPHKPIGTISTANGFIAEIPEPDKGERFFTTTSFLLYPYARGHVHIMGQKLEDDIDLTTGILTDTDGFDLVMAMWLYKKQREIARRMEVYRGEYLPMHPPFDADSDAACKKRSEPLPSDVEDIVYSSADDAVLEQWVRERLSQNWHAIGTCKMGPAKIMGVVDPHLSVHGMESLKIADLSIVPVNLAANPANMAFTIGEKASDIFANELKYVG